MPAETYSSSQLKDEALAFVLNCILAERSFEGGV